MHTLTNIYLIIILETQLFWSVQPIKMVISPVSSKRVIFYIGDEQEYTILHIPNKEYIQLEPIHQHLPHQHLPHQKYQKNKKNNDNIYENIYENIDNKKQTNDSKRYRICYKNNLVNYFLYILDSMF